MEKREYSQMKRSILTTALSFMILFAFAQPETIESKHAIEQFEKYYRTGKYDSVYSMLSEQTRVNLTLEKTRNFLTQVNNNYGTWISKTFLKYESAFAVYKTEFEKGTLILRIALNNDQAITGLFAKPYEPDTLLPSQRNSTVMRLPFQGEWTVFWGGDTKALNYHVSVPFQKNAFDLIITDKQNRSFRSDGKSNEDYYAFGQPLIAPCDGEIVLAVDGVKDNVPGVLNPIYIPGNSILLKTKNGEYLLFAHFKQNSIKVKQGDKVRQGQLLGQCGNSGNSSEPHLHFHIQNMEDFGKAVGIKCYFEKLQVNGILKTNYSPVKADRIKAGE
jgi:murein DD-endopeptidase MepM/ murein hydrolase activator NlpD